MIDYRELLKKFILVAGEDSGQCQVLHVTEGYASIKFSQDEKAELLKLKQEAEKDYL
jgi:hypothetical protein